MKRREFYILIVLFMLICSCGPKEIGQGVSDNSDWVEEPASTAEQMRQPMTGYDNTQRMLYYYNKPAVMENMQRWRMDNFKRKMGIQPDPADPAYREVPKQRSPFRH